MKLYTSPGAIACADCGHAVHFDYEPTCWQVGFTRGRCLLPWCVNYKKDFKFPLPAVEVEFIEQEKS